MKSENGYSQAYARNSDSDTSHEAASQVGVYGERNLVIAMFQRFGTDIGISDENLAYLAIVECQNMISPQGLRSRRCELTREGYIEFTGGYGTTDSGRRCRLYRLTKRGHDYAASLS